MTTDAGRRRFLRMVGAVAVSAGSTSCGGEEVASSTSGEVSGSSGATMSGSGSAGGAEPVGPDGFTYCGNVSGLPEGALIGLRFKQVIIARDALGIYAMTSICTHEFCNMLADGGIEPSQIVCGCHKTYFDVVGAVIKGPAKTPLDHFETVVDDGGEIFVHLGVVVDPDTRAPV